ncbi:hypothetical protein ASZ90_014789 [hydrocarbon metagenome]|uniref:Uncharacterized protein n=1 Tax=hydrocarbon metagenome TaxID=938273 RepID=A0A0W8F3Q8_9ZZZZ
MGARITQDREETICRQHRSGRRDRITTTQGSLPIVLAEPIANMQLKNAA